MSAPTLRPMARVGKLLTLALACAFLVACGGEGSTSGTSVAGEPISFEQLARSATTSADARSGRLAFSFEISMSGAEDRVRFAGEGAFDATSGRSAFSVDMSAFAALLGGFLSGLGGADAGGPDLDDPDGWQIEAVRDGDVTYVKLPAVASKLPAGKTWVRADAQGDLGAGTGFDLSDFEGFTQDDPQELLKLLQGVSGEIETVGVEQLRGAETTHYRAVIDPSRFEELVPEDEREQVGALAEELLARSGFGSMPLDVWIDGSGLVRKLQLDVTATDPGSSETSSASVVFELWDLGERVEIELPPASRVVDASALRD